MSKTPEQILEKIQKTKEEHLKELDLGWIYGMPIDARLTRIPPEVFTLTHLRVLNLRNNLLRVIPESLAQLRNLTSLNVSGNQLTTVPECFARLPKLALLDLSFNPLTTLPDSVSQLHTLQELGLRNCQLTSIPDQIYALSSLKALSLQNVADKKYHNTIQEITLEILQLEALQELNLEGNPLETPPPEIVAKGVKAIQSYFRQKDAEGVDCLAETNLIIVGEIGAGKTTLAKKINNPEYQLQDDNAPTEEIQVIHWELQREDGTPFRVNIWDFDGREMDHTTHQLFSPKPSLYALVLDTGKEDSDVQYWLNVIHLIDDSSPILIIKNEKQDHTCELNEHQLCSQYTNLRAILAANFATNRGFPEILHEIKRYICHLPQVGVELPKTWVSVRKALENDPRNYINLDEYLDICEQCGMPDRDFTLQLSGYLHDLGLWLHFQDDPLLHEIVILKPEWGINAIYKVLDNAQVLHNSGSFSRTDLDIIWHEEEYDNVRDKLLQVMLTLELCYKLSDSDDTYLVPQRFSENQPVYKWPIQHNLLSRYTYDFMPTGILTRLIATMHTYITNQKYVWKAGVVVKRDYAAAEIVEYPGEREIQIRIFGQQKKELLSLIMFKLDNIHALFKHLKCTKFIPCNCAACQDRHEPNFYSFDLLREFLLNGQSEIQCQRRPYRMVNILALIDEAVERRTIFPDLEEILGTPPQRVKTSLDRQEEQKRKALEDRRTILDQKLSALAKALVLRMDDEERRRLAIRIERLKGQREEIEKQLRELGK